MCQWSFVFNDFWLTAALNRVLCQPGVCLNKLKKLTQRVDQRQPSASCWIDVKRPTLAALTRSLCQLKQGIRGSIQRTVPFWPARSPNWKIRAYLNNIFSMHPVLTKRTGRKNISPRGAQVVVALNLILHIFNSSPLCHYTAYNNEWSIKLKLISYPFISSLLPFPYMTYTSGYWRRSEVMGRGAFTSTLMGWIST